MILRWARNRSHRGQLIIGTDITYTRPLNTGLDVFCYCTLARNHECERILK